RSVNVHGFARDALLLGGFQKFQGAHIVQSVGELNQDHADVLHHGQQHFSDVFRLPRLWRHHIQATDLGYAFDQLGNFRPEALLKPRHGEFRIFDDVVQQRRGKRGGVHAYVGKDVRDFEQVGNVGVAGTTKLVSVALGGNFVGAPDGPRVFGRPVPAQL